MVRDERGSTAWEKKRWKEKVWHLTSTFILAKGQIYVKKKKESTKEIEVK